jgi:hypothetical protein
VRKASMRARIMAGPPYSPAEVVDILDYCADDTRALARLLGALAPSLRISQASMRGQYMAAAARMNGSASRSIWSYGRPSA